MSYRAFFLAVLSLTLGGCAVYDYDNDYYGRRYYDDGDYPVHRNYYEVPRRNYYIVDHRDDDRNYDRRYYDRRDYDGRKDYYKSDKRFHDKRFHDNDRKFHHQRRYYQQPYDNFQERRHDYTPRLQTWGKNNLQPGYRESNYRQQNYRRQNYQQPNYQQQNHRQHNVRQQYRVEPGYEARPHNPRYNNRSDWSMKNRR
ncbi:hypothetical protein [Pseudomonas sp. BN515]|uniref:hypothetical protein n=1 Tax=Pseudomonas sp. BN515 TaxID=2567892 RepID=UPI002455C96D|nr:hypothetical protein [Pseudomonas sp. BN515]MDH4871253.1 hypothetical protein [Pseudomonas sp. BN515]